ncbi:MAG: HAMP domain-containing protein [Myxococcaceae bacterium]|nr:HAMP domain-containing protein [Myxococcaceae bacterium]
MLPRSLRLRLLFAFLAPALALFGLAGAFGYTLSRGRLEAELGESLAAIAAASASQINGGRLLTIEPGDDVAQTRTWRNVLRTLTELKEATGARRLVAFDTQGRVRVDAGGGLPTGAEMPELARDRLELERVLQRGERAASQVLFEYEGQLYKTGYAPIRDDSGTIVGAIAVEASARFWDPLRQLAIGYLLFVLLTLAVLGLVAVAMANTVTRPLRRLVSAATRIGGGDLSTPVAPDPSLEVGALARELEAMRQALESRDRQLKMMLAGVAHEVRNPIGGIELFAGVLAEELGDAPADAEARGHVERIRSEIDYLKRIVEDFLAFAREQKIARARFDAKAWVHGAVELLRTDAESRSVRLEVQAVPATIEGDEGLLTSALVNLVKNAIQASPSGTGVVEVRAGPQSSRYVVEVRDQGAGIPAEQLEQLFEPFFTTREKGTGLGLPLAKKIVQAHGGEMRVRSRPGETVFELSLPLAWG